MRFDGRVEVIMADALVSILPNRLAGNNEILEQI
jgi:hypothetical protein